MNLTKKIALPVLIFQVTFIPVSAWAEEPSFKKGVLIPAPNAPQPEKPVYKTTPIPLSGVPASSYLMPGGSALSPASTIPPAGKVGTANPSQSTKAPATASASPAQAASNSKASTSAPKNVRVNSVTFTPKAQTAKIDAAISGVPSDAIVLFVPDIHYVIAPPLKPQNGSYTAQLSNLAPGTTYRGSIHIKRGGSSPYDITLGSYSFTTKKRATFQGFTQSYSNNNGNRSSSASITIPNIGASDTVSFQFNASSSGTPNVSIKKNGTRYTFSFTGLKKNTSYSGKIVVSGASMEGEYAVTIGAVPGK